MSAESGLPLPSLKFACHIYSSIYLSIYPFIYLSIHSSIHPFIHLSIHLSHAIQVRESERYERDDDDDDDAVVDHGFINIKFGVEP